MQYLEFGNSGMEVSRLCLGAMSFGSKIERGDAARVVDEALENGVNFIDTADSYGDSEEILGEILSGPKREQVYVATKVYRRFCRGRRVGRNSRVNIINSLERSLRLLRTDYVDLYQLHHPDPQTPLEETMSTLDMLVRQGKIRYIGVSNHYAWQMATMIAESESHQWEPLISVQANYDILDRQVEMETVPFCDEFNIAMMCYSPLCGGILTGKYMDADGMPQGSRAASSKKTRAYLENDSVQATLRELKAMSEELDVSMSQLSIMWLLGKPHATVTILGGSNPSHFTQQYDIADRELDLEIAERIDKVSASRIYGAFRNQPVQSGAPLGAQW